MRNGESKDHETCGAYQREPRIEARMSGEIMAELRKKVVYDGRPIWRRGKDFSEFNSDFGSCTAKGTQPVAQL